MPKSQTKKSRKKALLTYANHDEWGAHTHIYIKTLYYFIFKTISQQTLSEVNFVRFRVTKLLKKDTTFSVEY